VLPSNKKKEVLFFGSLRFFLLTHSLKLFNTHATKTG
jgi:hypothetical protein